MINPQEGRLTTLNGVFVPRLDTGEPYRLLSGGVPHVYLSGDDLDLDLSEASVLFPGGAASGGVLAQPLLYSEYPLPTGGSSYPIFSFVMQPPGIEVSGPVGVHVKLPSLQKTPNYVQQLPDFVLLVGVDPKTLTLTPIGVGHVDRDAGTLESVGLLLPERLDVIGVAIPAAGRIGLLSSYADGELTLEQLRSAVRGY